MEMSQFKDLVQVCGSGAVPGVRITGVVGVRTPVPDGGAVGPDLEALRHRQAGHPTAPAERALRRVIEGCDPPAAVVLLTHHGVVRARHGAGRACGRRHEGHGGQQRSSADHCQLPADHLTPSLLRENLP